MKKTLCAAIMLAVLAMLLSGCGMILVEDEESIQIGLHKTERILTERC